MALPATFGRLTGLTYLCGVCFIAAVGDKARLTQSTASSALVHPQVHVWI
jgi:hypothetical protein